MLKSKKVNWDKFFCLDEDAKFGKGPCHYYLPYRSECQLLKKRKMPKFFHECRADPYKQICSAIERNLRPYKRDLVNYEYLKSNVETSAEKIKSKLNNIKLKKGPKLGVFIAYIRMASRNESINLLRAEKIILRKRCVNCLFFDYGYCQRDAIVSPLYGSEINDSYKKVKNASDTGCADFSGKQENSLGADSSDLLVDEDTLKRIDNFIIHSFIEKKLKQRIDKTKSRKKKQIRERQFLLAEHLYKLLDERDLASAKRKAAQLLQTDPKTIENDLKEIAAFLQKEIVANN